MDAQDQTPHTTPSGHENHGVHLCHRCGWPFPNPHPSAKHRRAHKKICGTIEGYTNLIVSEVVSDDEHHSDSEKEKTPSPKIEIKGSFSRSEDEFADAVTEFVDSGSANKTLDRDMFFSFKDGENADTNEVLNAPIETSKVHTISEEAKDSGDLKKTEETEIKVVNDSHESNVELTGTGDLVKDGIVGPASEPKEAKSIDVMEAEKGQESQNSETIYKEAKDSEITKTTREVSAVVGGYHDNVKQENFEKLESVTTDGTGGNVSEVVKESESVEEIEQEIKPGSENVSEVVKESETVGEINIEEIKHENTESDHKHVPEVAEESETNQNVSVVNEKVDLDVPNEQIQEIIKEPAAVLTEKNDLEADHKHVPEAAKESKIDHNVSVVNEKVDLDVPSEQIQQVVKERIEVSTENDDLEAPKLEKSSREQIQEAVKEPATVLIEEEDPGTLQLEKQSTEHTHEVVKNPDSVMTEKDLELDTVLTEKEDLGESHLKKQSNEHTHEDVREQYSVLTEKEYAGAPELKKCTQEIVEEPDSVLTEKGDLGSKDEVIEQKVNSGHNLVADVSTETLALKDSSDNSVTNNNNASAVVPEPIVEEGNGKLMNNGNSGADLTVDSSSHNSLDGTWGSGSVLSTASIDAETLQSTEKSKVNSGKSNTSTSDVFEPPSFMTLVETKSKDNKSGSCEPQDSQQPPKSEASQAGWFPTLTDVNNESEGRKKNEEAIAKVTNLSTGKQSTPLKNLLGEARSPSGKQSEPVVQKDEAAVNPPVNDDVSSPPKLIDDGKKGRKKVKGGISSWVPFVCCSSVNAVK